MNHKKTDAHDLLSLWSSGMWGDTIWNISTLLRNFCLHPRMPRYSYSPQILLVSSQCLHLAIKPQVITSHKTIPLMTTIMRTSNITP